MNGNFARIDFRLSIENWCYVCSFGMVDIVNADAELKFKWVEWWNGRASR